MSEVEPGSIVRIINESSGEFVVVDISEEDAVLRSPNDSKGENLQSYPVKDLIVMGHI